MNQNESASVAVDVHRLLLLVQNNPAIYNSTMNEHLDADVIKKIWTDIGKELNVPGYICKQKWTNLRSTFARHLRDSKRKRIGYGSKKKKWYLADAMEFLLPWTGDFRKISSNPDKFLDPDSPYTDEATINYGFHHEENNIDEACREVDNNNPEKNQIKISGENESESVALDVYRLLFLIEKNPAIYNSTMTDHLDSDVIKNIWTNIGKELNVPGYICKQKWTNLRSTFARHLRDLKRKRSGYGSKKKKWYLADAMEFLLPWTGDFRKIPGNLDKFFDPDTSYTEETTHDFDDEEEVYDEGSVEAGNNNTEKKPPTEVVTTPMFIDIKTIKNEHKLQEEECEFLSFFKILIPDAEKLTAKRKRNFKTSVMTELYQLLDEQEDEQPYYNSDISLRVASSCSDKSNNQDFE
uniref:MADF domain-containing protein n=2 Tax=Clastoptera arizonana TaxID=38151 RepID=A0A1B6D1X8_9HEMI